MNPSTGRELTREALLDALHRAAGRSNEEWIASLSSRKRAELEFHDADRASLARVGEGEREKSSSNRKFYSVTRAQNQYVENWVTEHARGKVFLDYACGEGVQACLAARTASLAIGLDISATSLELARQNAARQRVLESTFFLQGDCEHTGLPDNSIDTVLCSGMLHHLDLSYAFPELRRILKPGGSILAVEALNYNPAIRAYRRLTPHLRTEFERQHILSLKDVRFARRFFRVSDIRYWNLAVLAATPVRHTRIFPTALSVLERVDRAITRIPGIAQMAWSFSFVLTKPTE